MDPSRKKRARHQDNHVNDTSVTTHEPVNAATLSPHTLRLIRLVREGTAQHAEVAVSRLSEKAKVLSPLQLWNCLGLLQEALWNDSMQCRLNAGRALESIARHLPLVDQQRFMTETYFSDTNESDGSTVRQYLTVQDVQDSFDQIYKHGQRLWAESEDSRAEADLEVDSSNIENRMRQQRAILAGRLGLGSIEPILEEIPCVSSSGQIMSREDIEQPKKKAKIQDQPVEGKNSPQSVRTLLILAMSQSLSGESHRSPQQLLATELLLKAFDPKWTIRHGALVGILAILKAWKSSLARKDHGFGTWPHDLLARCLCLLMLDRLADFRSSRAIAPCRALAGQIVAVCLVLAPKSCLEDALYVLECQYQLTEWEARQGSLMTVLYITSIITDNLLELPDTGTKNHHLFDLLPCLEAMAVSGLKDDQDDVQSVAAQILRQLLSCGKISSFDFGEALWQSLMSKPSVSSVVGDLLQLAVSCLDNDAGLFLAQVGCGLGEVLGIIEQHAGAEYSDIRESAVVALGQVARTIVQTDLNQCASQIHRAAEKVFRIFVNGVKLEGLDHSWTSLVECVSKDMTLAGKLVIRLMQIYFLSDSPSDTAANALAEICTAHTELTDAFVRMALGAFSTCQFQGACILLRRLNCQNPSVASAFHAPLTQLLSGPVNCLRLSANDEHQIQNSSEVKGICGESLVHCLGMVHSRSVDAARAAVVAVDLWETAVVKQLGHAVMHNQNSIELNIRVVRVQASIAACLVEGQLPEKITPCVRILMTSLKNETVETRRNQTRDALCHILCQIRGNSKAFGKILCTMCDCIISGQDSPVAQTAAGVIQGIVRKMPEQSIEESLPQFWTKLAPLVSNNHQDKNGIRDALVLLREFCEGLSVDKAILNDLCRTVVASLVSICCEVPNLSDTASATLRKLGDIDGEACLRYGVPAISLYLENPEAVLEVKRAACELLQDLAERCGPGLSKFVRVLLPLAMRLMTDKFVECAGIANNLFAQVVRVAPLTASPDEKRHDGDSSSSVLDHLILGKPLPAIKLPSRIAKALASTKTHLRAYQTEGVSWLQFLGKMKLNGALCDEMGLGKTLQALVAISLAHHGDPQSRSIIVCPSTLVGHWTTEIDRFFGKSDVFRTTAIVGNEQGRRCKWNDASDCNILVMSYATLRADVEHICPLAWNYCVLDEGHLLKNPKTATAIAAKKVKAQHRLILSGTPVQNNVNELWSVFDFLMPNFLGTSKQFSREFSRVIQKGQGPGASAEALVASMDTLKVLHQQVLPFILRREKRHVLQELPEKTITLIKVPLSPLQKAIHLEFCKGRNMEQALQYLDSLAKGASDGSRIPEGNTGVLKSLLFLRMLCTHPVLVSNTFTDNSRRKEAMFRIDASGKLIALAELLRDAGVCDDALLAADADSSLLYCEDEEENDCVSGLDGHDAPLLGYPRDEARTNAKCLVFAQFTQSLDVVENLLFKPHMPTLRYLRLDGKVPPERRQELVSSFNENDDIRVLLISSRVGSLGLNLTSANIVVFLEHDYNPFVDLQAMDRAHRIGQKRNVNVYKFVCEDSIEERIVEIQERKVATSDAIVNTQNSTLFSMGTDRLLDIFTFRTEQQDGSKANNAVFDLENLLDEEASYDNLNVKEFASAFKAS